MIDFIRRCLLIVVFVLTIALLFVGGNKERIKELLPENNSKNLKMMSNNK